MSQSEENLDSVAQYLPEGLDEQTLEKVSELIAVTVQQRVQEKVEDLSMKVQSFIRGNIEKLKEQAIKELELENETFRNAQMFETVRSMFVLENTSQDEVNGMNALASLGEQQEEKNEALLRQVDKLLKENVTLKRQAKVSNDKSTMLEEALVTVKTEMESINENSAAERKLSDSALVISEDNFDVKEADEQLNENHANHGNEWINQGVLEKLNSYKG
jgi:hypothetical protein|tara:strand:+ start:516 stop:1169 length:654 start_codon:yes stop_codon:yes gene_type:complete